MMKKHLLIFILFILFSNSYAQSNILKKPIEISAKQTIINFLKAYKKSNYDSHFGYKKELITNVAFVKNDTVTYYRVNFKNAEEFYKVLEKTNYFSMEFIEAMRQNFKENDNFMLKDPANDGPPYGFDYDWILSTQEPELYLQNWAKIKVVSEKKMIPKYQEVVLQFEYGNKLQFLMKKEDFIWKICTIKSIQSYTE